MIVTKGTHPYIQYDKAGFSKLRSCAIYEGSDKFAYELVPAFE